jgi:AcrR family transcriptional regulator
MSTSRARKRSYHHGELQSALLTGAGQILEKQGIVALSVREAARRAGVSHNAPYRHFPDRESLLAALAAEGFERFAQALEDGQARAGLRGRGEAYLRFARENPERFRLMFGGEVPMQKHPALREAATRAFSGLAGALAQHLSGAPSGDASIAAWALVHGLASLLLNERIASAMRGGRSDDELARAVLGSVRFAANPQAAS